MPHRPARSPYWIVDFDRCLGDVDVLFARYVEVLHECRLAVPADVRTARLQMEATGGSFDIISYLERTIGLTRVQLARVNDEFLARSRRSTAALLPGADDLLRYLFLEHAGRYGIMTFGNPGWQRIKIAAVGLADMSCLVVDSPLKARRIATWYDEANRTYVLPDELSEGGQRMADEIVLIDDKQRAFAGMHARTRGYWVAAGQKANNTSAREVAGERVIRVANLREIIERERSSAK